jgi:hypothetical protein
MLYHSILKFARDETPPPLDEFAIWNFQYFVVGFPIGETATIGTAGNPSFALP